MLKLSVRQATISLSLLLAYTSRYKPWESLWSSSATTPLVDFHHRLTACPSYVKKETGNLPPVSLYYSPSPGSTSAHHIPTDAFITKAQAYNIILLRLVRGEEVMPIVWIVCAIEMYPLL